MNKVIIFLLVCLSPVAGFEPAKKHTKQIRTSDGKVVSREKKDDEILVVGRGNLKFKGSFYLKKGTGLKFFYGVCGGHGGQGDFSGGPPNSFRIYRQTDGVTKEYRVRYKDFHSAKTKDFELFDGDVVRADVRIF